MGTKNNPGDFDCYHAADPDEPMFILLGRDKHAPTLVWLWAALRELDGEDPAKVAEARECCAAMIDWAFDHNRKAAGIGQAALAGVLELMRAANFAARKLSEEPKTTATGPEIMRIFLSKSEFRKSTAAEADVREELDQQ